MVMGSKELKLAEQIDAWAREQARVHRRECRNSGCCGRTLVWWVTRHPDTSPRVANPTAVAFVVSQEVCTLLEMRLVEGQLPWLPGEAEVYADRAKARQELPKPVGRRVGETLPPRVGRSPRRKNPEPVKEVPVNREVPRRENPSGETLDWVDSLTSRRSY